LREAKNAIGRNKRFVNGCAGRSTSVVEEACSEASDAEGYFFNGPLPLIADGGSAIEWRCALSGHAERTPKVCSWKKMET
jgi:hypothetical protein